MLILAPIDQTGWRSAVSGVARAISSMRRGAERAARRGQHDLLDRAAIAVGHRLENRVVLGIDRQQRGAGFAHRAQHDLAGADQRFLVGQRRRPRRGGSRPGSAARPAAPVIAAMVQSAGSAAASTTASGPAATSMPVPASASRSAGIAAGSATTARSARSAIACSASSVALRPADQGAHLEAFRRGGEQIDRLGADAAGAAQDGDAARNSMQSLPQNYSTSEGKRQQGRDGRRGQQCVEPIEQAAMAGNDTAGILDRQNAASEALQQVARLGTIPRQRR